MGGGEEGRQWGGGRREEEWVEKQGNGIIIIRVILKGMSLYEI